MEASRLGFTTAVSVDVVALTVRTDRLEVLLVRRAEPPYQGCWALPGRFVRKGEDLAPAAARGLAEKAGAPGLAAHLEQLGTYGAPDRDPRGRVVTVAYLAFAPAPPSVAGSLDARWFGVASLPSGPPSPPGSVSLSGSVRLAFDHAAILADGVERARAKLEYSSLGAAFCAEPFTAADLRRVYEAVWGVPLDPRNFWRKISSTPGLLVAVPGRSVPGPTGGRPAARFRRGPATVLHPPILRPQPDPCPPGAARTE
jgi:8-oxo-dGTP diphosphatase